MPSRKRGTAARGPGDRPELRLVPPLPVSGAAPPSASESAQLSASGSAAADPEAAAREVCLRMLTAAPRTRAQLYSALSRRGVPDETAEAVLGRFAEVGLIDDAMFAASWVESRHHGRGLSARALAPSCGSGASQLTTSRRGPGAGRDRPGWGRNRPF